MARARRPIKERIKEQIQHVEDCWIWQGCKGRDGYGVLTVGRKQLRAHRASYAAFVGEIPDGKFVCHHCDTPLCVNPSHLFCGSPRANTQDMIRKQRKGIVCDDAHPATKVRHAQRLEILQKRETGSTLNELAKEYGVAFQTISDITNRRRSYGRTTKR